MANSTTPKLPQLPWPIWAGASLLLHAGALVVSVPTILPVEQSPSDAIPITLVDEGAIPTAAPTAPPPSLSSEASNESPLGGQNTTVQPEASHQSIAPTSQEISQNKPATSEPDSHQRPTKPNLEPPDSTDPAKQPKPPNATEVPAEAIPETPPAPGPSATPQEDAQSSEPVTGNGNLAISIVSTPTVPAGTPGDWPDILPQLQSTSTINVAGHTCQNTLPAGDVTVGVVIGADGSVIQAFAPPDDNAIAAQTASCLLTHALNTNPAAIRFSPAYTGQQAVITDRLQLTLQFSED